MLTAALRRARKVAEPLVRGDDLVEERREPVGENVGVLRDLGFELKPLGLGDGRR